MSGTTRLDRIGARFTAIVIGAMQILLTVVIAVAVLELFWLLHWRFRLASQSGLGARPSVRRPEEI